MALNPFSSSHRLPKFIDPRTHAVLDYATAATFLAAAYRYRGRHRRAATLALVNGVMVLGASLLTNYPGGVWPTFSFKTHGRLDAAQAALAGLGPSVMGFRHDREARLFHAQAGIEAQVISATRFEESTADTSALASRATSH